MKQAGKLRHRVRIEKRSGAKDDRGQPLDDWALFHSTRAQLEDLRGVEYFAAAQVNSEVDVRVTIRWRPGITPQMRVKVPDARGDNVERLLEIVAALDPRGERRRLELMCRDVTR
jgi:SPP1 family predicted phage head-tail adaptor